MTVNDTHTLCFTAPKGLQQVSKPVYGAGASASSVGGVYVPCTGGGVLAAAAVGSGLGCGPLLFVVPSSPLAPSTVLSFKVVSNVSRLFPLPDYRRVVQHNLLEGALFDRGTDFNTTSCTSC